MSTPQTEDGYVRIANELLEAILRYPLSKRELLVVMAIIRKTYGFNKKTDDMSGQQIADITGLKRQHVNVCVCELSRKNIVLKRAGKYGQVLGINKKYSEWSLVPKQDYLVPKQDTSQIGTSASPKTGLLLVPKQDTQKTTPKDNFKRHSTPSPKTGLPEGFTISQRVVDWAKDKGFRNLEAHFENFVGQAKAKGYKYADWDAAFKNAIRNDWAKVNNISAPFDPWEAQA